MLNDSKLSQIQITTKEVRFAIYLDVDRLKEESIYSFLREIAISLKMSNATLEKMIIFKLS